MSWSLRFHAGSRRRFAWLAAVAILLGALLPPFAQLANARPSHLTPICAEGTVKWVDPATGERYDAPDHSGGVVGEHCPLCLQHAPALPAPLRIEFAAAILVHAEPALPAADVPRPPIVWAHAFSRPPPARA
jgi:hypothetical protein